MCKCLALTQAALKEHNTEIVVCFLLPIGKRKRSLTIPTIATQKIETRKRGKAKTVVASFCPFCGEKYPDVEG